MQISIVCRLHEAADNPPAHAPDECRDDNDRGRDHQESAGSGLLIGLGGIGRLRALVIVGVFRHEEVSILPADQYLPGGIILSMKRSPPSEGYKKSPGHRRPAAGYARGEETRLRIIRAAVELFGQKGFDRVSTRDIAARAGVNAPVLQYYFEGKEGLYVACIEYMQLHTTKLLRPVIDTVRKRLEGRITREGLIDCVC